jgi:hypothetical protein
VFQDGDQTGAAVFLHLDTLLHTRDTAHAERRTSTTGRCAMTGCLFAAESLFVDVQMLDEVDEVLVSALTLCQAYGQHHGGGGSHPHSDPYKGALELLCKTISSGSGPPGTGCTTDLRQSWRSELVGHGLGVHVRSHVGVQTRTVALTAQCSGINPSQVGERRHWQAASDARFDGLPRWCKRCRRVKARRHTAQ